MNGLVCLECREPATYSHWYGADDGNAEEYFCIEHKCADCQPIATEEVHG